ncbi:MAG: hypothetical protein P4L99_15190 [Chthoniobacter sp.]|nr:hypothetical protein [Chthoniobacter sp.]
MRLPIINHALDLVIKGETHHVTCTDVFDGGCGFYFDALFPKAPRRRLTIGAQCASPELGRNSLADFASYPKRDTKTVRFFIPKW